MPCSEDPVPSRRSPKIAVILFSLGAEITGMLIDSMRFTNENNNFILGRGNLITFVNSSILYAEAAFKINEFVLN